MKGASEAEPKKGSLVNQKIPRAHQDFALTARTSERAVEKASKLEAEVCMLLIVLPVIFLQLPRHPLISLISLLSNQEKDSGALTRADTRAVSLLIFTSV